MELGMVNGLCNWEKRPGKGISVSSNRGTKRLSFMLMIEFQYATKSPLLRLQ